MLVVEGDGFAPLGEITQRGQVGVRPEPHIGGHERGAVVGRDTEHTQRLAERNGGLVGHPGQLAAAHHADYGQTGSGIHRRSSLTSPQLTASRGGQPRD